MKIAFLGILLIIFISCKKEDVPVKQNTVRVINVGMDLPLILVNYFGKEIIWSKFNKSTISQGRVRFGEAKVYNVDYNNSGIGFEIVSAADTLKHIFNEPINFKEGKVSSLYVVGTGPYEVILKHEDFAPFGFADSAVNVRFINLSPNSPEVSVNLKNDIATKEVSALKYKEQTSYKKYNAFKNYPDGSLTFEVRDRVSNVVLTTISLDSQIDLYRFKSITLVIYGSYGVVTGNNAYQVLVNKDF